MLQRRLYSSLFFALALLFAQQGSALHALHHVLDEQAQQKNKQAPATHDCEQCISYGQIGSALGSTWSAPALLALSVPTLVHYRFEFPSLTSLTSTARGPPDSPAMI
jgi:hypothetical protein